MERFKEFDGWPMPRADLPEEPIDRHLLLTNATLYWLTRTAGSSSWTYYEGAAGMPTDQTKVPTGVSHPGPGIRRLAERKNTIVHWSGNHGPSHTWSPWRSPTSSSATSGVLPPTAATLGEACACLWACASSASSDARSTWPGQPRRPLIWEAA